MSSPPTNPTVETTSHFAFSQRAIQVQQQPISYLMAQAVANPELISLAAGLVDYQTLPAHEAETILRELLGRERSARIALQYGTTEGLEPLRQTLLEHMATLDNVQPSQLGATVNDLVVTSGSQQLLFLLTDVLVNRGDIVITEWPTYFVYTSLLELFGASVRSVDMDEKGMIPESLDALLAAIQGEGQLNRVKIIYTCDYHQNPTGITLSAERRPQILDVVQKYSTDHRILIIEDAAYRELTYEGESPPSIKKFDTDNEYVALAQTFSKPFSPGVRTGYGLLPHDLVEPVVMHKGVHDFGSGNLMQHLLLHALREGAYAEHVKTLCREYAAKRDAMLRALDEHLGDFEPDPHHGTRWTKPTGGLYVYLTLPDRYDTGRESALFQRAIESGVIYVPGEYCFGPDNHREIPRNTIRLSYGVPTVAQIEQGVARLANAIKAMA